MIANHAYATLHLNGKARLIPVYEHEDRADYTSKFAPSFPDLEPVQIDWPTKADFAGQKAATNTAAWNRTVAWVDQCRGVL